MNHKKEEITWDASRQELMREYDGLIGLTLLNLWSISKEKRVIRLYHFDRKNKEHMFVLRVALMARDIYQYPIEVEGSWWSIACLNWKIRKGFKKVQRATYSVDENGKTMYCKGGIPVPELLDFMRPDGIRRCGESFTFSDIYETYYEGSK